MESNLSKSFPCAALAGLEPAFCSDVSGAEGMSMFVEALAFFKKTALISFPILGGGHSAMESRALSKLQMCSSAE